MFSRSAAPLQAIQQILAVAQEEFLTPRGSDLWLVESFELMVVGTRVFTSVGFKVMQKQARNKHKSLLNTRFGFLHYILDEIGLALCAVALQSYIRLIGVTFATQSDLLVWQLG